MADEELSLQEIEEFQQELEAANQEDELVYLMGLMGRPDMIERTVRREVEKRWLSLEARLRRNHKSDILH